MTLRVFFFTLIAFSFISAVKSECFSLTCEGCSSVAAECAWCPSTTISKPFCFNTSLQTVAIQCKNAIQVSKGGICDATTMPVSPPPVVVDPVPVPVPVSKPSPCPVPDCAAPPPGCRYVPEPTSIASCPTCGTLVCIECASASTCAGCMLIGDKCGWCDSEQTCYDTTFNYLLAPCSGAPLNNTCKSVDVDCSLVRCAMPLVPPGCVTLTPPGLCCPQVFCDTNVIVSCETALTCEGCSKAGSDCAWCPSTRTCYNSTFQTLVAVCPVPGSTSSSSSDSSSTTTTKVATSGAIEFSKGQSCPSNIECASANTCGGCKLLGSKCTWCTSTSQCYDNTYNYFVNPCPAYSTDSTTAKYAAGTVSFTDPSTTCDEADHCLGVMCIQIAAPEGCKLLTLPGQCCPTVVYCPPKECELQKTCHDCGQSSTCSWCPNTQVCYNNTRQYLINPCSTSDPVSFSKSTVDSCPTPIVDPVSPPPKGDCLVAKDDISSLVVTSCPCMRRSCSECLAEAGCSWCQNTISINGASKSIGTCFRADDSVSAQRCATTTSTTVEANTNVASVTVTTKGVLSLVCPAENAATDAQTLDARASSVFEAAAAVNTDDKWTNVKKAVKEAVNSIGSVEHIQALIGTESTTSNLDITVLGLDDPVPVSDNTGKVKFTVVLQIAKKLADASIDPTKVCEIVKKVFKRRADDQAAASASAGATTATTTETTVFQCTLTQATTTKRAANDVYAADMSVGTAAAGTNQQGADNDGVRVLFSVMLFVVLALVQLF